MRATLRSRGAVAFGCGLVAVALFAGPLGLASAAGFGLRRALVLAAGGLVIVAAAWLRRDASAALAVGWLVSAVVFGLDVAPDAGRLVVGTPAGADQSAFMWMLEWWPHALTNGLHPVMTEAIFGGEPYNLMRTTSIPLPALVMWPLTALAGPIVSYNALMLAAPALATWTAFLLCRHVSGAFGPSLLGALVFGFSPYMAGHLLAHANLALVALVPLAALLVVRRFEGTLSTRWFVGLFALLLAAQFAISAEVFAGIAVSLALVLVVVALAMPLRRRLVPRVALESAAAGALGLVLVAPLVYYALRSTDIEPYHSSLVFSGDLENLVVPSPITALGGSLFADVAEQWTGNFGEDTLYLGLPLLALVLASWRRWPLPAACCVVALLLALGAQLHVGGVVTGFDLPWDLADELPLLEYALPVRFSLYAFLAAAVLVALVLRRGAGFGTWALVLAGVALLVPSLESEMWRRETNVPALFESERPLAGQRVLILPDGQSGDGMLYQALSGFSFDMAGGYVGVQPPWHVGSTLPVLHALDTGELTGDSEAQLLRFVEEREVDVVVLDLERADEGHEQLLSSLGQPSVDGGVALYRVR